MRKTGNMQEPFHHLTVGYPSNDIMMLLIESAKQYGFEAHSFPKHWSKEKIEKIDKFHILHRLLESGSFGDDELLLVTDAYDVLIVDHSASIMNKFYETDADIIFNAETTFFPSEGRAQLKKFFLQFESQWRFLNSGCYIGRTWAVKHMLKWCLDRGKTLALDDGLNQDIAQDDQALATDYFVHHHGRDPIKVKLDTDCKIFGTLNAVHHGYELRNNRVYLRDLNSHISIVHGNGDKGNVEIIRWFGQWLCRSGPNDIDLGCLVANGKYVHYDRDRKKLIVDDGISENVVLGCSIRARKVFLFTAAGMILTFLPDNRVHCDAMTIGDWEAGLVRDGKVMFHERGLNVHDNQISVSIDFSPIPLMFFRLDFSEDLVRTLRKVRKIQMGAKLPLDHIQHQSLVFTKG